MLPPPRISGLKGGAGADLFSRIAVPVEVHGKLAYWLAADIHASAWQSLIGHMQAPQGGFVTVFDEGYRIVARSLHPERFLGQVLPEDGRRQMGVRSAGFQKSTLLEGGEPDNTKVRQLIRKATLSRRIQPVLCGSGREHIGVQLLLDAVVSYLPCPLDRPAVTGTSPKKKDREETRKTDPKEPFCGLIFKIVADSHGELAFVRVYSGVLKSGTRALNATRDTKELITKIYHTEADPSKRDELEEAQAGDIVAVIGLKDAVTGDTLCETANPIILERIRFAESVVSQSVEPESGADKQKLADVLEILRREDPTFNVKTDPETGQTLMSGMGTLHLEIKRHRMERDFNLRIRVGKPRVSYRETLRDAIEVEGECQRTTASGQIFGKVKVAFEPIPLDQYSPAAMAAAEAEAETGKKAKGGKTAAKAAHAERGKACN